MRSLYMIYPSARAVPAPYRRRLNRLEAGTRLGFELSIGPGKERIRGTLTGLYGRLPQGFSQEISSGREQSLASYPISPTTALAEAAASETLVNLWVFSLEFERLHADCDV